MRAAVCGLLPLLAAAEDPTVSIPGVGKVTGVSEFGGRSFYGIPYAAPPVGDLRWQPPAAHAGWDGARPARAFGAACMGADDPTMGAGGCEDDTPASEDCLFVNVFTPAAAPAKPLPVMVWVHGGAYATGCSNLYAGSPIVEASNGSVIVVTMNYRLNVFGFSGSAKLAGADGGSGNYGIQDQRAALQWVHDHIAAFGGDAGSVMIFGESAGGNSMINHLTQPASFGLYHKVVVESGTYAGAIKMDTAEKSFTKVLDKLDCTKARATAACARDHDAAAVLAASAGKQLPGKLPAIPTTWGPVIDGVNLVKDNYEIISAGEHNTKVPVMLGSNRDEAAFFIILLSNMTSVSSLEYTALTAGLAPGKGAQLRKLYDAAEYPHLYPSDLGPYNKYWWATMRLGTDVEKSLGPCSVRRVARDLAATNPSVYTYLFAHPSQTGGMPIPGTGPGAVTVPHASEISFVYNCGTSDPRPPSSCKFAGAGEADLGKAMSSYWINFAKTGDPNSAGAVQWPKFTTAGDHVQRLDTAPTGITTVTGLRKDQCDFWAAQ